MQSILQTAVEGMLKASEQASRRAGITLHGTTGSVRPLGVVTRKVSPTILNAGCFNLGLLRVLPGTHQKKNKTNANHRGSKQALWCGNTIGYICVCVQACVTSKLNRTSCYTTNPFLTLLELEWLQGLQALQLLLVI